MPKSRPSIFSVTIVSGMLAMAIAAVVLSAFVARHLVIAHYLWNESRPAAPMVEQQAE